ncbi:MAG: hypothetical protein GWP12_03225, partial [Nitrospirae bacterium]|nr:hypothetical protein [Nitrospirota bacterium]
VLLVVLVATWIGSTIAVSLVADNIEGSFCTLAMPLQYDDDVDGWSWSQDHSNNCEWTLFRGFRRAPESVYIENGFEPPSDLRLIAGLKVPALDTVAVSAVVTAVPLFVVAGIVTGIGWLVRRARRSPHVRGG